MVSSDEIRKRLEAKRKGIEYHEPVGRKPLNTKECPSCHTENPPNAKFCVGCGNKLETAAPEKSFTPEIKGTESSLEEKQEETGKVKVTPRPDDFGRTSRQEVKSEPKKLEPIVPKTPESGTKPAQAGTPIPQPRRVEPVIPEIKTVQPKAPETKTPEPIQPMGTEQKQEDVKHPDVDPVERIKKAKELLDIGAITQEEFDMIKSKYLDEI